jgi:hypothetical protein
MVQQLGGEDEKITRDEDDESDHLWAYTKSGYDGPPVTDSHETDSEGSPMALPTYRYPDGISKKSASRHREITSTYIPERKLKTPPKRGRAKKTNKQDKELISREIAEGLIKGLESEEMKDRLIEEGSIVYAQYPGIKGKCQKEG